MNALIFLNRQINLTQTLQTALMIGAAIPVLSSISIYSTMSRLNQLAYKAVIAANFFQMQGPGNLLARGITFFNPVTLPYFLALGLHSVYFGPDYGLQTQFPRLIESGKAFAAKLPSQAQVTETVSAVIEKIPTKAQVSETLNAVIEKIPTQAQVSETVSAVIEKIPTKAQVSETVSAVIEKFPPHFNRTAVREFCHRNLAANYLILVPAIASVAIITVGSGFFAYQRWKKKPIGA